MEHTYIMCNNEFKTYYNKPTKIQKIALEYARKLFCEPMCLTQCAHPCPTHAPPNTLKNEYQILNHNIHTRPQEQHIELPPPLSLEHPKPPSYIFKDPTHFPIQSIRNDRPCVYTDKYKITKKLHVQSMPMDTPK